MVDKMMKYSFILLSGETEGFLNKLQELGVVDITRSAKPVDDTSARMLDNVAASRKLIGRLESLDFAKDSDFEAITKAYEQTAAPADAAAEAQKCLVALGEFELEKAAAAKEISQRLPWGDFDKGRLDQLNAMGFTVRYYIANRKVFSAEWAELYPLEIISEDKNNIWFVTVVQNSEEYSFPIETVAAPEGSWKEAQARLDQINERLIDIKAQILKCRDTIPQMKENCTKELTDLDLYLAKASTESVADDRLDVLEGFAPEENDAELSKAFDEMGVLYIKEKAVEDDNPPIKLKNNWFARQFEVLTGMYGMPVYGEADPTPIVAPFFLLFFAMCMGDAGYGILLILIGMFLKYKMADSGLGKMHGLVTFLGIGTLVIGLFLGTFFGMSILEASWAPSWLKAVCVDGWFPDGKIAGFPAQMVLAVGIGVFHICLAMVVKTIGYTKRFGFRNTISTWGWTLLIVGGIILTALGMMEVMGPVAMKWSVIALAVISCLGIFIFNTPGRNPLMNIGSGLWDTYNMVTGLLGDVLSYIRLYALGLAGGMLGNAFNIMGTMILDIPIPGINWAFCIVILIFGHVLNLAMSCLGAFVHPLRLTFVEYFKNSGYEGTGKFYNPLTTEKE